MIGAILLKKPSTISEVFIGLFHNKLIIVYNINMLVNAQIVLILQVKVAGGKRTYEKRTEF